MRFKHLDSFLEACWANGVIIPDDITFGIEAKDFDKQVPEEKHSLPNLEYNYRPKRDQHIALKVKIVRLKCACKESCNTCG